MPVHADQIVARLLTMLPPLELLRVAEWPEVEHLAGASRDTLKREHPDKVVKISPRREGMRVAHALMLREINETEVPASSSKHASAVTRRGTAAQTHKDQRAEASCTQHVGIEPHRAATGGGGSG